MASELEAPPYERTADLLGDVLLRFPAVAAGGVRWSVLSATLQKAHKKSLDAEALGFSSALSAAHALLPPGFYVANASDADDPIVAAVDELVLVPRPGAAATWPGHYRELVEMVLRRGNLHRGATRLLASQVKRLSTRHTCGALSEGSWDYFLADGRPARVRHMKRLLAVIVELREQRRAWAVTLGRAPSLVDCALAAPLTVEISAPPSSDLYLCVRQPGADGCGGARARLVGARPLLLPPPPGLVVEAVKSGKLGQPPPGLVAEDVEAGNMGLPPPPGLVAEAVEGDKIGLPPPNLVAEAVDSMGLPPPPGLVAQAAKGNKIRLPPPPGLSAQAVAPAPAGPRPPGVWNDPCARAAVPPPDAGVPADKAPAGAAAESAPMVVARAAPSGVRCRKTWLERQLGRQFLLACAAAFAAWMGRLGGRGGRLTNVAARHQ